MLCPALTIGALTLALFAPGAAAARTHHPASSGVWADPWEKFNRRMFALNQRVDRIILIPLSRLASGLTPGPIGRAIHNFVVNLNEPVVVANDLLQARPGPAIRSAFRLVINTTIGGLGVLDVAKALGDPHHENGFGDTLGRWGAMPGPYLVLPVLGPSTIRDMLGSIADDATLPLHVINYPYRLEVDITVSIVGGLNQRSELGPQYDALLAGAADPYATLRSSYLQAREAQIRGDKALPPLPDIEEVAPPPPLSPGASPSPPPPPQGASAPDASPSPPPSPPSGVLPPLGGETGASPPPQGEGDFEGVEGVGASDTSPDETRL
jgi:phospholipid-binding lipoprotein MlaA